MTKKSIIETKELTIRFGGHIAVNRVNLQVEQYTLKSIIGPNGAGKTTLFNLLTGQYKPTEGSIFFKGKNITSLGSDRRARLGFGRAFQLTNIFSALSILENVRIAVQARMGFGYNFWKKYEYFKEATEEAYSILENLLQRFKS